MKQLLRKCLKLLTLVASMSLPVISDAQTTPQYNVREAVPPTGSMIRRDLAEASIAINQPYAELSAADKAIFRSNYSQLSESDEPPFPKSGLQSLIGPIADLHQKFPVGGTLFLIAVVAPNGKIQEVKAISYPTLEMARFASTVLMLTEFKPAVCAGQPCSMEFPLRMRLETL